MTSLAGSAAPAASRCLFIPFTLDTALLVYEMFWVNGSANGNNVDVGLYDETLTSLVTLGSTATSGTGTAGYQVGAITDVLLDRGRYFMGFTCDGTTSQFQRWNPNARWLRLQGCLEKLTTFPLPTGTVTPTAVANAQVPQFGLHGQSVS